MIPLSPQDIRDIHEVMLERYGGLSGEHEPGLIEFMSDKPFQEFAGQELYPGLFVKAAVYMHGFATVQYFADGNKRTAYGCAAVFLELNGYSLIISDDDLFDTCKKVANKQMTIEELAFWIRRHAKPHL